MERGADVRSLTPVFALPCALVLLACQPPGRLSTSETRAVVNTVRPLGTEWQGPAIAYSGYRQGQSPDSGVHPSRAQVAEDLRILAKAWRLLRVYS
ncbi:MAG: hypothetical protein H6Q85_872, partial [candidate division NC10 bacterium]|nr:hypothetical protein [candidate division NC10 bacterium]